MFNGLLIGCPIGQERHDCPFAEVRRMKFIERGTYLEKLPVIKRVRMHKEHIVCLRKKERELERAHAGELSFSL